MAVCERLRVDAAAVFTVFLDLYANLFAPDLSHGHGLGTPAEGWLDEALVGKTVVPFATSGGSGMGDSSANLQVLAPKAKVVGGRRFRASVSADDLRKWAENCR